MIRSAWSFLLVLALLAAPVVADEPAPAAESWLLATYHYDVSQRVGEDNGIAAMVQDQMAGQVPLLMASQDKPGPVNAMTELTGKLVLFTGKMVEREVETVTYESETPGVRPTKFGRKMVKYRFFLASAHEVLGDPALSWKNEGQTIELAIDATKLPGDVRVAASLVMDNGEGTIRFCQGWSIKPGGPTATAWVAGGTMPRDLRILVTNLPCDLETGRPALAACPAPAVSIRIDRIPDRGR